MKRNKKINVFLFVTLFFIFIMMAVVYEKEIYFINIHAENEENTLEYSEEYKKWLARSDEEGCGCFAPSMYDYDESVDMSVLGGNVSNILNLSPSDFESKFSLGTLIPDNLVYKGQGATNNCWGFAAIRVLETSLALNDYYKGNKTKVYNFSERHVDYASSSKFKDGTNYNGFSRRVGSGGDSIMAFAYFTNGTGAILEEDMPYESNENLIYLSELEGKTVSTRVYDIDRYTSSSLNDEGMLAMKNHIKNYGGLKTGIDYGSATINYSTCAMYASSGGVDHAVVIVGWDDNYSRTNFKSSNRPKKDGAWIAINSNSSTCKFLYISYYDIFVSNDVYGFSKVTTDVNYDNIYQHDWYGPTIRDYVSSNKLYLGNVFERDTNEVEYLTDVAIHGAETYKVKVYVNPNGTSMDKSNLQQVKLKAGDSETFGRGYHTLEFTTPIKLSSDSFAVVLEIESDGTKTYFYKEANTSSYSFDNYVKISGKSYYSDKNIFEDSSKWIKLKSDNTIKAFTINGVKKLTLKANPKKTSYVEGENFNSSGMIIEATYSNGKTKVITNYTISNDKNLSVNQNSVKVTYLNQSLNVPISVEKNIVSELYMTNVSNKTEYIEGDDFDSTGMIITAVYKNGTKKQVTNYELINATNLGIDQTYVTISYGGKQINQSITVLEKQVEDIVVKTMPDKLDYSLNSEQLDLTGGILEVTYNNGFIEEILMTDQDILVIGFDNSQEGKNEVELVYKEKSVQITVDIVRRDGGINSNLVYGICDIQEIKTINSSNNSQNTYAIMEIEVSHIMRDMTNDSFEYYYYLSSDIPLGVINDWTKISEEQLESDKLRFIVNTKNIENSTNLKNYEMLNLYIKEVATKNKIGNEVTVRLVLPMADEISTDSEIGQNKSKMYVVLIVVILSIAILFSLGMYFYKIKKRNNGI